MSKKIKTVAAALYEASPEDYDLLLGFRWDGAKMQEHPTQNELVIQITDIGGTYSFRAYPTWSGVVVKPVKTAGLDKSILASLQDALRAWLNSDSKHILHRASKVRRWVRQRRRINK